MKEKDCKFIFETGFTPREYEFNSADLAKACAYANEKKWPVVAIKTPWAWLSWMDPKSGDEIMTIFDDVVAEKG